MKKHLISIIILVISVILLNACSLGKMCDICGERLATKTYENMLGVKMHVCRDCYHDVEDLSSYVN